MASKNTLASIDPNVQVAAAAHATQAQACRAWAQAIEVAPANMEQVGSILTDIKGRVNVVEAEQKKMTAPVRAAEKAIRDFFRPALTDYQQAERILKEKISLAVRAQTQANDNAMRQAQVALEAGKPREAALAANVIESTAVPANISVRPRLRFEIVNPDIVPRELCSPDDAKVAAWVKAHGESHPEACPGVRVWMDNQVSVRQS